MQDLLEQTEEDDQEHGGIQKVQDDDDEFIENFDDFERNPEQEDVYDYFLDAHKEEN